VYNWAGGVDSAKAIIEMPQQPPGQQPPVTSQWCTKLVHLWKMSTNANN